MDFLNKNKIVIGFVIFVLIALSLFFLYSPSKQTELTGTRDELLKFCTLDKNYLAAYQDYESLKQCRKYIKNLGDQERFDFIHDLGFWTRYTRFPEYYNDEKLLPAALKEIEKDYDSHYGMMLHAIGERYNSARDRIHIHKHNPVKAKEYFSEASSIWEADDRIKKLGKNEILGMIEYSILALLIIALFFYFKFFSLPKSPKSLIEILILLAPYFLLIITYTWNRSLSQEGALVYPFFSYVPRDFSLVFYIAAILILLRSYSWLKKRELVSQKYLEANYVIFALITFGVMSLFIKTSQGISYAGMLYPIGFIPSLLPSLVLYLTSTKKYKNSLIKLFIVMVCQVITMLTLWLIFIDPIPSAAAIVMPGILAIYFGVTMATGLLWCFVLRLFSVRVINVVIVRLSIGSLISVLAIAILYFTIGEGKRDYPYLLVDVENVEHINFHGVLLDQKGKPVSSAAIKYRYGGLETYTAFTDKYGRFLLRRAKERLLTLVSITGDDFKLNISETFTPQGLPLKSSGSSLMSIYGSQPQNNKTEVMYSDTSKESPFVFRARRIEEETNEPKRTQKSAEIDKNVKITGFKVAIEVFSEGAYKDYIEQYNNDYKHKAFAISLKGAWGWASRGASEEEVISSAMRKCQKNNEGSDVEYPCRIVNINHKWIDKKYD